MRSNVACPIGLGGKRIHQPESAVGIGVLADVYRCGHAVDAAQVLRLDIPEKQANHPPPAAAELEN